MPDQSLLLAHQVYAAWNRGDLAWFEEHLAADAQVRPILPEFDELYVGLEGWRRFWKTWDRKWSRISVERIEDLDEHGALALLTLEREGSSGQGSMPTTHWLQFRNGKLSGLTAMSAESAERRYAERE